MVIGVISDTHGLLRPEALDALRGSQLILHAGDIGSPEIIPALQKIAPTIAVRGNVDEKLKWAREFHDVEVAEAAGLSIYMLHNIGDLDLDPRAAGMAAVVFGHSHKPEFYFKNDVLYFNPGSAGPRRFSLPVSVGRMTVRGGEIEPEILSLVVGR